MKIDNTIDTINTDLLLISHMDTYTQSHNIVQK